MICGTRFCNRHFEIYVNVSSRRFSLYQLSVRVEYSQSTDNCYLLKVLVLLMVVVVLVLVYVCWGWTVRRRDTSNLPRKTQI